MMAADVIEIEAEKGVDFIAQADNRLITELPVAVVEDLPLLGILRPMRGRP
jgi:hypothetical protein